MFDSERFSHLMNRIRAGDEQAAVEMVRDYESLVKREVRLRLEDSRLRRVLDSMDVCQSVFASFFVRTALGEYDLSEPKQLVQLLVAMTRNKVASHARRENSQKRDHRRNVDGDEALELAASDDSTPSRIVAFEELLGKARSLLRGDERRIVELRTNGASWEEIANDLGGTAQARRVQYARALERVRDQMGLRDDD